jgi:hypothetical protein
MENEVKKKGGRPLGSTTLMSQRAIKVAKEQGDLPHEFLLRIARGEVITRIVKDRNGIREIIEEEYDFQDRKDAAKACAPYYAPKISTVEVIRGVSDNELDSIIAQLAAEAGISASDGGESSQEETLTSARSRARVSLKE